MLLPTLPHGVAEAVGRISIRGRMALAARCFDDACAHFGLDDPEMRALSDCFWSFTSTMDMGAWETSIPDGAPQTDELMKVTSDPSITHGPSWKTAPDSISETPPAYLRMPFGLAVMVVLMYDEIGRGNLYSGVQDGSRGTWNATLRMLACMRQMGLPLPALEPFLRSPFTEDEGWGLPRPREFFAG